jgi:hypothetical protein
MKVLTKYFILMAALTAISSSAVFAAETAEPCNSPSDSRLKPDDAEPAAAAGSGTEAKGALAPPVTPPPPPGP